MDLLLLRTGVIWDYEFVVVIVSLRCSIVKRWVQNQGCHDSALSQRSWHMDMLHFTVWVRGDDANVAYMSFKNGFWLAHWNIGCWLVGVSANGKIVCIKRVLWGSAIHFDIQSFVNRRLFEYNQFFKWRCICLSGRSTKWPHGLLSTLIFTWECLRPQINNHLKLINY